MPSPNITLRLIRDYGRFRTETIIVEGGTVMARPWWHLIAPADYMLGRNGEKLTPFHWWLEGFSEKEPLARGRRRSMLWS